MSVQGLVTNKPLQSVPILKSGLSKRNPEPMLALLIGITDLKTVDNANLSDNG
jgi:hypothetical protein